MGVGRHITGSTRRVVASLATICFTAGLAIGAWSLGAGDDTHAAFLPSAPVDLALHAPRDANAFLRADNLAPGDLVRGGALRLTTRSADTTVLDLDVGLELTGPIDLSAALHVERLHYGRVDILDAPLKARCDTDRDGRVSLAELRCGLVDLPAPRRASDGGTPLQLDLRVDPRVRELPAGTLAATFRFHLADRMDADLGAPPPRAP